MHSTTTRVMDNFWLVLLLLLFLAFVAAAATASHLSLTQSHSGQCAFMFSLQQRFIIWLELCRRVHCKYIKRGESAKIKISIDFIDIEKHLVRKKKEENLHK